MYGEPLRAGTLNDTVLLWAWGDHRRALVGGRWPTPRLALEHVLRHFRGGQGHYRSVCKQLNRLNDSQGRAVDLQLGGGHLLRLAVPLLADSAETPTEEPVVLTIGARMSAPVVFRHVEAARDFARREQRRAGRALPWFLFEGERIDSPESFKPRLGLGFTGFSGATILDEMVDAALHRRLRRSTDSQRAA